jgi:TolB-like protein
MNILPRESTDAAAPSLSAAAIQEQVDRILGSRIFANSPRKKKLLQWAVNWANEEDSDPPSEHLLGIQFFGRPESWDPRTDPIVRNEFAKLREKVLEYYENRQWREAIVIEFPKRGFIPTISPRVRSSHKRLMMVACIGGVLALAAIVWTVAPLLRTTAPVTSVAVLPFRDLSADHRAESLCSSFTNEVTIRVAELSGFKMVGHENTGKNHVGTVVEGSVGRSGNDLRAAVQIVRGADGVQVWARNFESTIDSMQEGQAELSRSVAAALRAWLAQPPRQTPPLNPQASDLLTQAQSVEADSSPAALKKGAALLEQAVNLEPRFAPGWSGLADLEMFALGATPTDQLKRLHSARKHYAQAVSLDLHVAPGIAAMAYDNYVLDWDWARTESELKQALKVGPGAWAHQIYAMGLATRGKRVEARVQTEDATRIEPANPYLRVWAALTMRLAGDPNEAAGHVQASLSVQPGFFLADIVDGYLALDRHDAAAAKRAFERAGVIDAANPLAKIGLAAALAAGGDTDGAMRIEQEMAQANMGPLFNRALIHVTLGDTEGALALLEQSAQWHEQQIVWIANDPLLAPLRGERRFKELALRLGMERLALER